jgi:hypothetical protein
LRQKALAPARELIYFNLIWGRKMKMQCTGPIEHRSSEGPSQLSNSKIVKKNCENLEQFFRF